MLLEVEGVTRRFGGLCAVEDVTFRVGTGEIVALIGPNGAGKTTIFNLITGADQVTAGRIAFQGRDITRLSEHRVTRLGLARTYQNLELFAGMTALSNVLVGQYCRTRSGVMSALLGTRKARLEEEASHQRAKRLLNDLGLGQFETHVAENLPYGVRKRLEIARALATDPELLLLDEPVAGLNPSETTGIATLVRQLQSRGLTILLIEHDIKMVTKLADRIVVLNYGRKIAEGPPSDIQSDSGVIEAYLGPAA